jgi:hypothetical protein
MHRANGEDIVYNSKSAVVSHGEKGSIQRGKVGNRGHGLLGRSEKSKNTVAFLCGNLVKSKPQTA